MRHGPAPRPRHRPHGSSTETRSRPSRLLAAPIDTGLLNETELIDTLRALEDTKAALAAAQATLALRLDHTVRARHAAARVPAAQQGRDVAGLLAYARRESPAKGTRLLGLARALAEQPHTHAAMAAGALSEWRATLITRETSCLSREDRAIVDTQISAPGPDGTYRFDSWGDRRLVAETQKLVIALDPAAVVNRRRKAEADRHVTIRPAPDTMARISVLVPATQGIAVWATLTTDRRPSPLRGRPPNPRPGHGRHPRRTHHRPRTRRHHPRHHQRRDLRPDPPRRRPPTRLAPGLRPHPRRHHPARHDDRPPPASTRPPRPVPWSRWSPPPATSPPASPGSSTSATRPAAPPTATPPSATATTLRTTRPAGPPPPPTAKASANTATTPNKPPAGHARPINGPPGHRHSVETTLPTGHVVRSTAPAAPLPSPLRPTSRAEIYLATIVLAA